MSSSSSSLRERCWRVAMVRWEGKDLRKRRKDERHFPQGEKYTSHRERITHEKTK